MLSKTIHLLFILLLLSVFNTLSIAQIDTTNNSAQVVSYYMLHEKQSYIISYKQLEIVGTDTLTTIHIESNVAIEVVDSSSNSFTLEWQYKAVNALQNSPASNFIAQFLQQQVVQFETDELGVFKKVVAPKQYIQLRNAFIAKQANEASEAAADNCYFTNYFAEKQGIGIQELQTIHQFYNFHGLAYLLNEKLAGKLKEAESVNKITVPGTISVVLEQLYPERKTFVLRSTKTLNKEVFEQAMTATASTENLTGNYGNETTTVSVMHVSGWVILSNQTKIIDLPNKKIIEERVIKMNEDE